VSGQASAHGLGHLLRLTPSSRLRPRFQRLKFLWQIGVDRWQYDIWHQIIQAELQGHPDRVDLSYHPALEGPAASRYGATTPELLGWFKLYNRNRAYRD
jgi:hypothetical protein